MMMERNDTLRPMAPTVTSYWNVIYRLCGESDAVMFCFGPWLAFVLTFWVVNLPLFYLDLTGRPKFLYRYKIQKDKAMKLEEPRLRKLFKTILFNQLLMGGAVMYPYYVIARWRGCSAGDDLPSLGKIFFDLICSACVVEPTFYYSHRLLHHPLLYKHVHKVHHEWTSPIGLSCIYAHPIEFMTSNITTVIAGPLLMGSHLVVHLIWFVIAIYSTSIAHCGYHFPLIKSNEQHDYHHYKFSVNYGTFGLLDWLHGTDAMFRKSDQFKRHKTFFGIVPLSESIQTNSKKD
ncbi:fatty acid hydroxylase domain-containing protein 2-like [Glandiceps talaboti]